MNPYIVMAALFALVAGLEAVDAALIHANLLAPITGLRWLRVHFITLGMATEVVFGLLPLIVARPARPRPNWRTWALLNAGLIALIAGIPLTNAAMVYTGGTLITLATISLFMELSAVSATATPGAPMTGRWFYLAGLAFFLVGITIGTGLFFDWARWLHIKTPLEAHIHANNWGLMSLVFAGLLVDLYPRWAGRPLAWPGAIRPTFWLMTLGALGLVVGPWIGSLWVIVPGLLMHLAATLWLLANAIVPLRGNRILREPGIWHLFSGYIWILAPVIVAPLLILGVPGFPAGTVEGNAPQALVYGWLMLVVFALLPFAARTALGQADATLGGSWLSLAATHLGCLLLWVGIFAGAAALPMWHAAAYTLWAFALIPPTAQLWRIIASAEE